MRTFTHASSRSSRRRAGVIGGTAVLAVICMSAAACGGPADGRASAPQSASQPAPQSADGNVLRPNRPMPKPELELTDDKGKPFDLVEQTAGRPTVLFFGYTHCPDVCPTTMADVANAVKKLPAADQDKLRVVFVTTDPGRDTPGRLHQWLRAFDDRFIGLSGDFSAVEKAARSVGVSVDKPVKNADGSWTVSHGAQVLTFSPVDDEVHSIYTSGTPAQRYEDDLPKLVKGEG